MIDCITIATNHHFPGNLLAEQHRLRYREVVAKESWRNIYTVDGMEFDRYDNLATEYLIARDDEGQVVGVTRSYPTTIPYMLSEAFTNLSPDQFPSDPQIFEASRLVLDRTRLDREQRAPVIEKLMLAYMERGLQRGLKAYIGFMLPKIWESTFIRVGWDVRWLGPEVALQTGEVVRAALMPVNKAIEQMICRKTGLKQSLLNFGTAPSLPVPEVANWSQTKLDKKIAA